jgi:hypothetical protein
LFVIVDFKVLANSSNSNDRNNSGNAAIVRHEESGWIFDHPEGCIQLCKNLRAAVSRRNESGKESGRESTQKWNAGVSTVIQSAKEYVMRHHSIEDELESYATVLNEVSRSHNASSEIDHN